MWAPIVKERDKHGWTVITTSYGEELAVVWYSADYPTDVWMGNLEQTLALPGVWKWSPAGEYDRAKPSDGEQMAINDALDWCRKMHAKWG